MNELNQTEKLLWYVSIINGDIVYPMDYTDFNDYSNKLNQYHYKNKNKVSIFNYKKKDFGHASGDSYWNYYSGSGLWNSECAIKCLESLKTGINWEKTLPMTEGTEKKFISTFQDNDAIIPTIYGTLYTKDNKEYYFIMCFQNFDGIRSIIEFIDKVSNKSEKYVIEEFSNRI